LVVLNRISDFLFAMARSENKMAGVDDIPWIPESDKTS
jgi:cob(I)alamin adenosyltransferase